MTAKHGHQFCGDGAPVLRGPRCDARAAKRRRRPDALLQPSFGAANRVDRIAIAGLRRIAPRDQPVARKHDSPNLRIRPHRVAQSQAKVEARPLPWKPSEFPAEYLARKSFTVARRRNRDDGIGMDVVDMRERQERMEGSVDAGGARAAGERAIVEE